MNNFGALRDVSSMKNVNNIRCTACWVTQTEMPLSGA